MPELQPKPKVIVAKRGDDYASLASKLGVEEHALIKANPNAYKVSAGAAYNVPQTRSLQRADLNADFQSREARHMMGSYGISKATPEMRREYEARRFADSLTKIVGGSFKNATYYGPGNVQPGTPPRGAEERAKIVRQQYQEPPGRVPLITPTGPQATPTFQTARETMIDQITKWPSFPGQDIAEIKLDRPEYWTNIGASQAVKSRIDDYMQQFITDTGEIDWNAALKQDPDLIDTLTRLGYVEESSFDMPDYTDDQQYDRYGGYYYPTPSYYGGGRGVIGEGRTRRRPPMLGLVSWSGM